MRKLLAIAAVVATGFIATPALAAVTFNTGGSSLSCNGVVNCTQNNATTVSFGGLTLSYAAGSGTNIVPTSFINLGSINASGAGSFDLSGLLLGININQTVPGGSGGLPSGSLFGTITGNSSGATISWAAAGTVINGYLYTVTNSPLAIVPPASCIPNTEVCGVTTIQGQVAAVPEPATWAMMLLGFGAIGFASRRRRSQRLLQIA